MKLYVPFVTKINKVLVENRLVTNAT